MNRLPSKSLLFASHSTEENHKKLNFSIDMSRDKKILKTETSTVDISIIINLEKLLLKQKCVKKSEFCAEKPHRKIPGNSRFSHSWNCASSGASAAFNPRTNICDTSRGHVRNSQLRLFNIQHKPPTRDTMESSPIYVS